jgi:small subunit ribosomal protein S2
MEEQAKLQRTLGGMRKMRRLPGAMFVIDPQREHIAVIEARKLEIPVIGTGDTNVDPDMLDYVIPANDDAIRAIRLLCTLVAEAAIEGAQERAARPAEEPVAVVEAEEEASDEMMAALSAGGTFSFEPEPDEEETAPAEVTADAEDTDLLPTERPVRPLGAERPERPARASTTRKPASEDEDETAS